MTDNVGRDLVLRRLGWNRVIMDFVYTVNTKRSEIFTIARTVRYVFSHVPS